MFLATIPPQEVCDSIERFLIPQELIRLRGLKKMIK
jgi:energy-coupling factor transporter transmembrane protein EcfT